MVYWLACWMVSQEVGDLVPLGEEISFEIFCSTQVNSSCDEQCSFYMVCALIKFLLCNISVGPEESKTFAQCGVGEQSTLRHLPFCKQQKPSRLISACFWALRPSRKVCRPSWHPICEHHTWSDQIISILDSVTHPLISQSLSHSHSSIWGGEGLLIQTPEITDFNGALSCSGSNP